MAEHKANEENLALIDQENQEADFPYGMYRSGDTKYISVGNVVMLCLCSMLIGTFLPYTLFGDNPIPRSPQLPSENETKELVENLQRKRTHNGPKIAWLMSFPNSGTSYTLSLVSTVSNMTMASNYGWEHYDNDGISVPVFEKGPYWLSPHSPNRPSKTVLTKTHCGGYCHNCHVKKFIETPHSFLMHCAMAQGIVWSNKTKDFQAISHVYDTSEVDRAVHLIRDPLDNMVSRYHLGIHKVTKQNKTDLIERYTYTPEGFKNYCDDQSDVHDELTSIYVDQSVLKLIKDIPCHMDLFRYVQWHNLAFIATEDFLKIPTHILHYEDYNRSFHDSMQSLLDFLELPDSGAIEPFESGKSYRDYYTPPQIEALHNATVKLASSITWSHLKRYFV